MSTALEALVYTREEAAELLKVGTRTIDRLLASRKLPHSKVGKYIRITQANLETYLESTRVKSDAELMAQVRSIELVMKSGRRFG